MKKSIYLVIDIGGTKIAASLFNLKGRIVQNFEIPTRVEKGPIDAIERLHKAVSSLLKNRNLDLSAIKGICVGCPGPFDKDSGKILSLPNLRSWRNFELKKEITKKFKAPVILENDANLAALGEATFGAGKGFDNVIYITFSTGIGGGFVQRGKIFQGATGDAFEVGHIIVERRGKLCGCGKRGCLEAYASGSALAKEYERDVQELLKGVKEKDKAAIKIWDSAIEYLGIGISNLIQIVNPDIIVIGGGISNAWSLFIPKIKASVKKYTWKRPLSNCKIVASKLKESAPHFGGFALLTKAKE